MRTLLANLGFVMQMSGALMIVPIIIGILYNENTALISLFATAFTFLLVGFALNSLAEKKILDIRSSSLLLLASILFMPLIGTIPYLHLGVTGGNDTISRVTNAYFESVSGFTTTGFSYIPDEGMLPESVILYRAMSELMGGLGLVFMLVALMYPERPLDGFSEAIGVEKTAKSMRRTYFEIFAIYGTYILAITAVLRLMGFEDVTATVAFVIHAITGGFAPTSSDLPRYFSFPGNMVVTLIMLLGALSFVFHHRIFCRRFGEALKGEAVAFLAIFLSGAALLSLRTDIASALFHAASFSSNAGFYSFGLQESGDLTKLLLITLMFIGGCGFSLAAGIRVSRLLTFFRSIGSTLKNYVQNNSGGHEVEAPESTTEYLVTLLTMLLSVFIIFLSSVVFSSNGLSYVDALFEAVSAFSTTGATLGAINIDMALASKWLVIVLMVIGRLEVMVFLVALQHVGTKLRKSKSRSSMFEKWTGKGTSKGQVQPTQGPSSATENSSAHHNPSSMAHLIRREGKG